jgi:hypothetical protein
MFNKSKFEIFLIAASVGFAIIALISSFAFALDKKAVETGSLDPGDVIIELIPSSYNNGKLTINVSMNTHSISLGDYDLAKLTVLEYKGKTYKPVKVKSGGGHHAYGRIVFELDVEPKGYTITITGIPKAENRVFKWN